MPCIQFLLQYTRLPWMISTFPELGIQVPWNSFPVTWPTFLVTANVYIIPAAIYTFAVYVDSSFLIFILIDFWIIKKILNILILLQIWFSIQFFFLHLRYWKNTEKEAEAGLVQKVGVCRHFLKIHCVTALSGTLKLHPARYLTMCPNWVLIYITF